jgi:hypothetical protein
MGGPALTLVPNANGAARSAAPLASPRNDDSAAASTKGPPDFRRIGGRHFSNEMWARMLAPSPRSGALWTSNSDPFSGERSDMTGAIPALSHRLRPCWPRSAFSASIGAARPDVGAGAGARPRRHRRCRREGDRRGGQHLDLADRRSQERPFRRRQGRDAAIAAGLAVRGILRRLLQEPPRRSGAARRAAICSRTRPTRSAPASSSTPPASS